MTLARDARGAGKRVRIPHSRRAPSQAPQRLGSWGDTSNPSFILHPPLLPRLSWPPCCPGALVLSQLIPLVTPFNCWGRPGPGPTNPHPAAPTATTSLLLGPSRLGTIATRIFSCILHPPLLPHPPLPSCYPGVLVLSQVIPLTPPTFGPPPLSGPKDLLI